MKSRFMACVLAMAWWQTGLAEFKTALRATITSSRGITSITPTTRRNGGITPETSLAVTGATSGLS